MGGRESLTRTKVENPEWGNGRALLEVEQAGRTCPRALDDVQVNQPKIRGLRMGSASADTCAV